LVTYNFIVFIWSVYGMVCVQIDKLDRSCLQYLAYTARGCFAPLCAFLGGVVAQEALKALTGKFTPVNQWVSYFIQHWFIPVIVYMWHSLCIG